MSVREYKVWRSAWSDYKELLQLSDQPASTQLTHFRSCLTPEMRGTLVHAIGIPEDDDTTDVGDILDSVHKHFQRQRNVTLRRVRFEERRQGEGELFDDYYVTLKELADDAELCDKCLDSRLVTRITSGIANQPLRRKLLAIDPPPDLQEVVRLCRSEESALRTGSDLDTAGNVKRVSVRQPRPRSATRGRTLRESKCMGCGGEAHTQGLQKQCNAWGKACSHCGIVGHFSNVCTERRATGSNFRQQSGAQPKDP